MAKVVFRNLRGSAAFWLCLVTSIGMEVAGLVIPPPGVIDSFIGLKAGVIYNIRILYAGTVGSYSSGYAGHGTSGLPCKVFVLTVKCV